jgi:hypothetical protein
VWRANWRGVELTTSVAAARRGGRTTVFPLGFTNVNLSGRLGLAMRNYGLTCGKPKAGECLRREGAVADPGRRS